VAVLIPHYMVIWHRINTLRMKRSQYSWVGEYSQDLNILYHCQYLSYTMCKDKIH
jgi:hypothetical protein